ncbi:HNH endonuclease [Gemella massiliensis]|uniref:HNH endonuclease n=1 Tax=Gemella massiliensis TaxID=1909670 RepID=UPI000F0A8AB0
MLKTCSYCQKIHDKSLNCKPKREYYRDKNNKYSKSKDYLNVIKSNRWKKLSRLIKDLDNNQCLVCRSCGLVSPNSLEVHHIEKVRENLENAFDKDNLITLCIFHHKQAENGTITRDELTQLIWQYREDDINNDIMTI